MKDKNGKESEAIWKAQTKPLGLICQFSYPPQPTLVYNLQNTLFIKHHAVNYRSAKHPPFRGRTRIKNKKLLC